MTISSDLIRKVTATLYERSLKKIPEDTKAVLRQAQTQDSSDTARKTLTIMLKSADAAEKQDHLICTDVGIPVYSIKIGTQVRFDGPVRQAIVDGLADLAANINPPILKMVTNPLTHQRGHTGKDMPLMTFDVIDDADYLEIICAPKAMGSGRWEALETFCLSHPGGHRDLHP